MTDVEKSTRIWDSFPQEARQALIRHNAIINEGVAQSGGHVVESGREGDSFLAVFANASRAIECALQLQRAFHVEPWPTASPLKVRVALHSGEAELRDGHYVGADLYRCARVMAIAHGGQVLLTQAVKELAGASLPNGCELRDLGAHRLRDISQPIHIFQLCHPDLPAQFPGWMYYRILGPLEVWDGERKLDIGGAKQRAVLAILLIQANRVVSAKRLVDLIWGRDAPETAAHALQVYVSQLRKALQPGRPSNADLTLITHAGGYSIRAARDEIDLGRFEQLCHQAQESTAAGNLSAASDTLRSALALWRGSPLADFADQPWAMAEATRLTELKLLAAEDLIEAELGQGRHSQAVVELEGLVAEHPLRERLRAQLMIALYRGGRQAEATEAFRSARDYLVGEAGVEPGRELQELLVRILKQDPALTSPVSAADDVPRLDRRPTPVYRPMGPHPLSPVIVGRIDELARLDAALENAREGAGRMVVLVGNAGVGKTRLATEAVQRADGRGMTILRGSCSAAELALPYLPLAESIGNFISNVDLTEIRKQLGYNSREVARLFPQLAENPQAATRDAASEAVRLYEALLALLRLGSEPHGMLLLVEDLHWADPSTLAALDYFSRRIQASRILVLATVRREDLDRKHALQPILSGWRRAEAIDVIDVEALGPDDLSRMIASILDQPINDEARDLLRDRSEGNPLVLEEMLKTALDSGDLYRSKGNWTLKGTVLRFPAAVIEVIGERFDRLGRPEKEVLCCAAVLGRRFNFEVLEDVVGRRVDDELESLIDQQLIGEDIANSGDFVFRHALTQEAIYGGIAAPRRQRLHGLVADVLTGRPAAQSIDIAHHLIQANRRREAIPRLLEAADTAESARAYKEAADMWRLVLELTQDQLLKAQLKGRIGEALLNHGDAKSALGYLEEAVSALTGLNEVEFAEHYRIIHAQVERVHDRHDLALQELDTAIERLSSLEPTRDLALALMWRGGMEAVVERGEIGESYIRRAIAVAETIRSIDIEIWSNSYLGVCFVSTRGLDESSMVFSQVAEEATKADLPFVAQHALSNLAANYVFMANPRLLATAIQRLRSSGLEEPTVSSLAYEIERAYFTGELESALESSRQCVDAASRLGNPHLHEISSRLQCLLLTMLGRLDEARPLVKKPNPEESLQIAIERAQAWCHFHLATGDVAAALVGARAVCSDPSVIARSLPYVDVMMESLIAGGDLKWAATLAESARAQTVHAGRPQIELALARHALASGDTDEAIGRAEVASNTFYSNGDRIDGLQARIVLSRALGLAKQTVRAQAELSASADEARQLGAAYLERKAAAT